MNTAGDPWAITQKEKIKFQEQFKSLQPQNGIVTGAQAKGFFLQSQLPPIILGQIWALADTDSDGKMNINEFSIACKLINLKLRGFEIPKALPPTMLASLSSAIGTPILTPTGSLSPLDTLNSIGAAIPTAIPASGIPIIPQQPVPTIPQAMIPNLPGPGAINQTPLIQGQRVMPIAAPVVMQPIVQGTIAPGSIAIQPMMVGQIPMVAPSSIGLHSSTAVSSIASPPTAVAAATTVLPAPPTPPQSNPPSRNMSITESSIESQSDWAIKGPAKLKYTQLFNTTDRTRSGYLTGVQARNILMQSKLPQSVLAQIWGLADMDSDGRLGCEEFVLAMYLCDRALAGEKIPTPLPADLIPPSFRKVKSRHGSLSGSRQGSLPGSRHASVSSQGAIDADPAAGLPQSSFEDKRKENFDKGQAELDRRRKLLMDQQKREQEDRERKEREEAEKREKARLEAEKKQQEELERQLQQQREIEMEKEEQRRRSLEAKEQARKELERQRQLEWEKQRISEMQAQKQREQEKNLKLKAHHQGLNVELSTLNEKIKDLSQKICDTRAGVTNVKTVIDGMRSTRDTQMTDMAQLKAKIKEQNQKLLQLTQEKAKWDAKSRSAHFGEVAVQEQMNAAFTTKQIIIKQLKDKIQNISEEIESKKSDINSNDIQLIELKAELKDLIKKCEELYADYGNQRNLVLEIKHNRKNESFSTAWDSAPAAAWSTDTNEDAPVAEEYPVDTSGPAPEGFAKFRAIYEFNARNADEISFQPGDIVLVPFEQNAEPGWLAGEINGHTGWFPETYVVKIEGEEIEKTISSPSYTANTQEAFIDNKNYTEPVAELESTIEPVATVDEETYNGDVEYYIAAYPYESAEAGDLNFTAGEMVMVSKKEGDWWTGTIGTRTGMFPSNYVQKADVGTGITNVSNEVAEDYSIKDNINGNAQQEIVVDNTPKSPETNALKSPALNEYESRTQQEELDIEVSQINTQPKNIEQSQGSYSRPMSRTSSMTPGMRAKKNDIAQVIAPYEATSTEQLSLTRGQLIMIRKKTDSGWWEGELQAKGRRRMIGWFPASYVKILQGGRNSGRNTPVSGSRIEMTETILDKVIALYPYKAQNDDELSFDKDDIISVLGRDEPEWWRGELNGLSGLFPSNYVGPFVSSGNV